MTWSMLSNGATTLIGLTGFVVLVRILGPTNYGLIGMASAAIAIPASLAGDTLSQSLIQQAKLDKAAQTATFLLELSIALILSGILIYFSGSIAQGFDEPIVATLIVALCPILVLRAAASVPAAQLRRNLQYKAIAIISATSVIFATITAVALAALDYGYWALIAMQITQVAFRVIGVFVASRWLPSTTPSWSSLRPLMNFNTHTIAIRLIRALITNLPRVLIGAVLGAMALGIFDVTRRLFMRINVLLMRPLNSVTLPVASQLQDDVNGLREWHQFSSVLITTLAYPLYIGIAAILPSAAPVFFGQQWLDAIVPMQLVMLIGIRNATSAFNADILRGRGKPELTTRLTLVSLAFSLVLLPLAVSWGVSVVICAMVIASVASWVVGTFYVDRELQTGIARQITVGWQSLASSTVMFAAVTVAHYQFVETLSIWLLLSTLIVLGALTHLASLWLLQPAMTKQFKVIAQSVLTKDRKTLRALMQQSQQKD